MLHWSFMFARSVRVCSIKSYVCPYGLFGPVFEASPYGGVSLGSYTVAEDENTSARTPAIRICSAIFKVVPIFSS